MQTRADPPADIMWHDDDGRVVLIHAKHQVQPKFNPGIRWKTEIHRWVSDHSIGSLPSFDDLPSRHFDEQAARNVTAVASRTFLLAVAVFEGTGICGPQIDQSRKELRNHTRLPKHSGRRDDQLQPGDADAYDVAAWLNPGSTRRGLQAPTVVGTIDQVLAVTGSVLEQELTSLLSHWDEVAYGLPPISELLQRPGRLTTQDQHGALCAVAVARQAQHAAIQARDAVINRPWPDFKEAVARFTEDWLNLRPTDGLVNATANALLFASLDHPDADTDPDAMANLDEPVLLGQLRKEAIQQHRAHRFLGETQLRGKPVDYLDRQISPPGAEPSGGRSVKRFTVPPDQGDLGPAPRSTKSSPDTATSDKAVHGC
jgi:hypothetical protein